MMFRQSAAIGVLASVLLSGLAPGLPARAGSEADSVDVRAAGWPPGLAQRPWYGALKAALAADATAAADAARRLAREHREDRLILEALADWIDRDYRERFSESPWPLARLAEPRASHVNPGDSLHALKDGAAPRDSDDHDIPRFTWWSHRGTREWVQYEFPEAVEVAEVEVYWFDDRPRGGQCRVPASWRLLYEDGGRFRPVDTDDAFGTLRDRFHRVRFAPVATTALRIEVQLQEGYSGGILEWRVGERDTVEDEKEQAVIPQTVAEVLDAIEAYGRGGEVAASLRARFDRLAAGGEAAATDWADLYLDAAALRRAVRLAPHREMLRRVVFAKHYDMGGSHYAYTEGQSDAQHERHFTPGGALCLMELDGLFATVHTLIEDSGGVLRNPDVCYEGRRVLFAWKKSLEEDDYHLHELDMVTGERRKLTDGLGFADYEGVYLPDGNIVFNSTRSVQTVDCWWTEVSNLFLMDGDGRFMRQVGFDQVHTNFPAVTCDGRVIYTRWDYNDRGQIYPQGLFQMNPDGTAQRALYGNNSYFPTTLIHTRSIPGTGKYVAIFTGHHSLQKGWLGIIDPGAGREENQGAQLVAPVRYTPADRIDAYGQTGDQFQYPYPLSEREFLVSFQPEGRGPFGIYYMDEDGGRELLANDPAISSNQPVPLRPRPRPAVRPSQVDYRQQTGTVYMHDVYDGLGLPGIERGAIAELRVIALEYRAAGVGSNSNHGPAGSALVSTPISIQGAWDVKQILGTVPVEPDGSALFEVPARTPLYFQAVDRNGHMVQTMRSWTTLMPGEKQSCVGCHDHKNAAPPVTGLTAAAAAGPQARTEFYGPPRGFSFIEEIQPILDRNCVACHHLDEPPPYLADGSVARGPWERENEESVPAFSLRGIQHLDEDAQRKWSDSYLALAHRRVADWVNPQSAPPTLPPYSGGSSRSPLIEMFESGAHFGVTLSREELDKFALWIDLLVPYAGDYLEAMDPEGIPRYLHFLEKRRRWQEEEARNIEALIEHVEATRRTTAH